MDGDVIILLRFVRLSAGFTFSLRRKKYVWGKMPPFSSPFTANQSPSWTQQTRCQLHTKGQTSLVKLSLVSCLLGHVNEKDRTEMMGLLAKAELLEMAGRFSVTLASGDRTELLQRHVNTAQ